MVKPSATTRPSSIMSVHGNNSFTSAISFKSMNQKVPLMFSEALFDFKNSSLTAN
jgi:hypothetical protein